MDEISNSTATDVAELKDGRIETRKIVPQEFGFDPAPPGRHQGQRPGGKPGTLVVRV